MDVGNVITLSETLLVTFGKVSHFDPSCIWRLCRSQTHRAITGITKRTPTNAPIEAPAHPHLGGAVQEETLLDTRESHHSI